jgi:hypothetical protein
MSEHQKPDPQREPLICVATAANDFEAQLMHDELAGAGIRSATRNLDALGSMRAVGVSNSYSIEILVLESDAQHAREILGDRAQD